MYLDTLLLTDLDDLTIDELNELFLNGTSIEIIPTNTSKNGGVTIGWGSHRFTTTTPIINQISEIDHLGSILQERLDDPQYYET